MGWILLAGAIVSEVTASLSLKAALEQPAFFVVVVIGYAAAFVLLAAVLRRGMALGVAYGVWAALGVAATALLSAALFGETLTPTMLAGIALVIAGVLCVELGSHPAAPAAAATPSTPAAPGGDGA
jgi:small multidrug resistance pump